MKKNLLLLAGLMMLSFAVISQEKINLVVFSEDGDAFFAYVNGIRQNDKPETNVKVTGVSPNVSLRIEFENKVLPQLKQNMPFEAGFEHTVRIRRDLKKQVKLTYFGQTPISDAPAAGVTTIQYHTTENPVNNNSQTNNTNVMPAGGTTVTSSSTTTTRSGNEDVNMNVNMAGVGISMNVNSAMPNTNTTMNSSSSTTVTRSSSSSSSSGGSEYVENNNNNTVNNSSNTNPAKGGCTMAMDQTAFAKMKKSVESQSFSDTKMSTAKIATKNACLSIAQVKEICKLFSMDDDKLTYAKYAHGFCVDKANYYQVSEVFSFSSTTDEFNKFLEQN
jgi:hypothetical protein